MPTSTTPLGHRSVPANQLKPGDWIVYANSRYNERVIDTCTTRDGEIKVHVDYGNGGEPATSFYEPHEMVLVI